MTTSTVTANAGNCEGSYHSGFGRHDSYRSRYYSHVDQNLEQVSAVLAGLPGHAASPAGFGYPLLCHSTRQARFCRGRGSRLADELRHEGAVRARPVLVEGAAHHEAGRCVERPGQARAARLLPVSRLTRRAPRATATSTRWSSSARPTPRRLAARAVCIDFSSQCSASSCLIAPMPSSSPSSRTLKNVIPGSSERVGTERVHILGRHRAGGERQVLLDEPTDVVASRIVDLDHEPGHARLLPRTRRWRHGGGASSAPPTPPLCATAVPPRPCVPPRAPLRAL